MNSFRTRDASLEILRRHPGLEVDGLPLDFLQSKEPKLRADDLFPVDHPADPELEWCPPGHGDVFVALRTTGLLAELRRRGFRHLFLSNADNLGATCDGAVPAWMAAEGIPYVAEMSARTVNDRKGGQLVVRHADGRLVLRDSAAVAPGEDEYFQDLERHRWFHTNNLWIDLEVLAERLDERDGVLGLPIIVNRKTVDPTDPSSTPVVQVESAMGAAVELFDGARAIAVPRSRFRPVKTTTSCCSSAATSTGWPPTARSRRPPTVPTRSSTSAPPTSWSTTSRPVSLRRTVAARVHEPAGRGRRHLRGRCRLRRRRPPVRRGPARPRRRPPRTDA